MLWKQTTSNAYLLFLTCPGCCIFRLGLYNIYWHTVGCQTQFVFLIIHKHVILHSPLESASASLKYCTLSSFRKQALSKLTFLGEKGRRGLMQATLQRHCKNTVQKWPLSAGCWRPSWFHFQNSHRGKKALLPQMTATKSNLLLNC